MDEKTFENIIARIEAIPKEELQAKYEQFIEERQQKCRAQIEKVTIPLKNLAIEIEEDLDRCQGCCEDVDTYFDIIRRCRDLAKFLEDFFDIY